MKKITFLITFLIFCLTTVMGQKGFTSKELKAITKNCKQKAKELSKDGWKISASIYTLEGALVEFEKKMREDKSNRQLIGYTTNCRSMNVCRQAALNNAAVEYATKASSQIEAKIVGAAGNDAADASGASESDIIKTGYINRVAQNIKGDLDEVFTLVKTNDQGLHELQIYFIINENTAQRKRIKAWESAAEEAKLSSEFAKSIEEFVREDVKVKK